MEGGHGQALLSTEEGVDSVWNSDAEVGVSSPDVRRKCQKRCVMALLLGASCLPGMLYVPPHSLKPPLVHMENLTKLSKKVQFRPLSTTSEKYYWPSARGPVGSYSTSSYAGPLSITNPTWTWHLDDCCAGCKWCTFGDGVAIDDQKNIYMTGGDVVRKFSSDGELLWASRRESGDFIMTVSALMDGVVYVWANVLEEPYGYRAFALSMDTGEQLWSRYIGPGTTGNNGAVGAHQGVVILAAEPEVTKINSSIDGPACHKLFGLNSTDGSVLWTFKPEVQIWNFMPAFADDGTFVYQDFEGRVYRNFVKDGTLLWKSGGIPGSWTDGYANLGYNGIVYGVANYNKLDIKNFYTVPGWGRGKLSAYRLSDGMMLWSRDVPKPVNAVPAIGVLFGQTEPSVVMPIGQQVALGTSIDIYAFNAETGEDQWFFQGPTQWTVGEGETSNETQRQRALNDLDAVQLPTPWAFPSIDGNGAVFLGSLTGHVFRLQDTNGDGIVTGPQEVSNLTTEADFYTFSSPAIAPGLLAITNAQSLIVWKY